MTAATQAELILVRHGETVGESAVRLYGATDIGLSDLGRQQMRRVSEALAGTAPDHLWVSPLSRSRESAGIVSRSGWPSADVVNDFREIDFGEWEGLTGEEVAERDPVRYQEWKSGRLDWRFPGGDHRLEFADRVGQMALRLFKEAAGLQVAVLHKGVVKTIIGALKGLEHEAYSQIPCELGSVHRLVKAGAGWEVASECEIGHLGPDRLAESR